MNKEQKLAEGNLLVKRPDIAKQWYYTGNKNLRPEDVFVSSHKKVWWKCEKGHDYQLRINDKVRKRHGCPVCSNRTILPGYNDLKTLRPEIAAEWAYRRNKLRPEEVGIHSNKKVWWRCGYKRHYWEARINDRTRKSGGTNCPYCAKKESGKT